MSEHLSIPEGTTWERGWPIVRFDDAGDPHGVSLTGYTVRSQVRRTPDSTGILHEWSSEAETARIETRQIEVWDRHHRELHAITTDLIVLHVDPWVSEAWTWREGVWDIKTYGPAPDFWEDRIGGGTVEVTQAVTRDEGDPPPLPPPPSLVVDHGALIGLGDDDHSTVYVRYTIGTVPPSSPRIGDLWVVD